MGGGREGMSRLKMRFSVKIELKNSFQKKERMLSASLPATFAEASWYRLDHDPYDVPQPTPSAEGDLDLCYRGTVELDPVLWTMGRELLRLNVSFNKLLSIAGELGDLRDPEAAIRQVE